MKIINLECKNLQARMANAPPIEQQRRQKPKDPDDFSAATGSQYQS